jgi:heme/copper-type cytochrome/quinol oxidase subunit 1
MSTKAIAIENLPSEPQPWTETLHEWVTTVDHKRLGVLYILYALSYLVIAGMEALIIRVQLMHAHNKFVSPQVFNRMFTMHGTTMIFFVAMPILFGFANYLVPLMIGARDMAFPRLNAFSFWLTALGGILLYFSYLGGSGLYGAGNAPDTGWWAYAPLPARAFSHGHSSDYLTVALLVSGFGSIGTAINILATVLCMRCPGMHLGRMPLLVWLNLVMSGMVLIAVTPLTAAQAMLLVDRYLGGHFFDICLRYSASWCWIGENHESFVIRRSGTPRPSGCTSAATREFVPAVQCSRYQRSVHESYCFPRHYVSGLACRRCRARSGMASASHETG